MTDDDTFIKDFLENMAKLMSREIETCIHCGKVITQMRKVGRCVYASPCGCRLWQGQIPDAWKKAAQP